MRPRTILALVVISTTVPLTAYSRPEDRERAMDEDFDAHVGKPFDPGALAGLIATLTRAS